MTSMESPAVVRLVLWIAAVAIVAVAVATAHADPPPPCTDNAAYDHPSEKGGRPGRVDAKDYVGKTPAQVIAKLGQPSCKSPGKWRYWLPRGCAYEKDVVTLWFGDGRVRRVISVHTITGEECMFDF
jgi:hypothetical protein